MHAVVRDARPGDELDAFTDEPQPLVEADGHRPRVAPQQPAPAVRGFVDNFNAFSEFDYRGQRWRLEFGGGNAAKWAYALMGPGPGEAA